MRIFEYVSNLSYKFRGDAKKLEKFAKMQKEFMELYGKIREQEKKHKEASTYPIQMLFYWHGMPTVQREKVFNHIRKSAKALAGEGW